MLMPENQQLTQLQSTLEHILDQPIGAEIFFIINANGTPTIFAADVDVRAQASLCAQFSQYLREQIINNDELSLLPISEADERKNVLYQYDLEEFPRELNLLGAIHENREFPRFNPARNNFSEVQGFLVKLGNADHSLALYKRNYPINLLKKSRLSVQCLPNSNRLSPLDSDVLTINDSFEFFELDNQYYIHNIKVLERFCGFHELVQREALRSVQAIIDEELLENPEVLEEELGNISFARKLTKVLRGSPVLGIVPNATILEFAINHPALAGKLSLNEEGTKFELSSKNSKKLFLKLLNDDYLRSELTEKYYDSLAKDTVQPEVA